MRAWHFLCDGNKLRDGRTAPDDGVMLVHPGRPRLCQSGLHASLRPSDALHYAPGNILCLVECGGVVIHAYGKLVCTERTIIARLDATEMLGYYARMQALKATEFWAAPDVVLEYLMTGDESLREAANNATYNASDSYSAIKATYNAACNDAHSAAHSAARAAAFNSGSAAYAATYESAISVANREFDSLVFECFENVI